MAIALDVRPLIRVEPECCATRCQYHPARVAYILRMIDSMAQSGYEPCEALMSTLLPPESPYENRSDSFGPSEPTGAQILADIHRAFRAGKRDPHSIAAFLCPFSERDLDEKLC